MNVLVVIPARLHSTRLPEKLLEPIHGMEILRWVILRVSQLGYDYLVATDHQKIRDLMDDHRIRCCMTSRDHESGTSRVTEVAEKFPQYTHYCIVQGDEPLISPRMISQFIEKGLQRNVSYLQAITKLTNQEEIQSNTTVKVVVNSIQELIYCSRLPIPYILGEPREYCLQICGIYLFRKEFLKNYKLLSPTPLEKLEKIEQLRSIENRLPVTTELVSGPMHSVDTPEELERMRQLDKSIFLSVT